MLFVFLSYSRLCEIRPSSRQLLTEQRELFYSFLETIRVIIRLNSRYYCPSCWLPIEKVPAGKFVVRFGWLQKVLAPLNISDQLMSLSESPMLVVNLYLTSPHLINKPCVLENLISTKNHLMCRRNNLINSTLIISHVFCLCSTLLFPFRL